MQQSSISNQEKQRQPQAGSVGGGRPSASQSGTSDNQLAQYRFELLEMDSTDYKLLRLTYLSEGNFKNKSVDFKISVNNPLVSV